LLSIVVSPFSLAHAERGEPPQPPQDMQQLMDMLKKQGVDPKQLQQMENMFKGMEGQGKGKRSQRSSAKVKKPQQQFETETAGHGSAQVELKGKQYDLTMTECEIIDRETGHFQMAARQAPGKDNVTLGLSSGGGHSGNTIQFSLGKNDSYEEYGTPTFKLKGKTLQWAGEVGMGSSKKVPLKFQMTCGTEMKDYTVASKPNPASVANVMTLEMGKETNTFQAGHCSTKEYRDGNLIVQFEATATGMFRGRPAIILISKSHPAESMQTFQNMDLLLGEFTPEQRRLSPLKVAKQLQDKVIAYLNKETAVIQKKRESKMAAFQEKYGKDVPQETDKKAEWMEAYISCWKHRTQI
jgi:hypothetical protein